jgi:hypothetical protein
MRWQGQVGEIRGDNFSIVEVVICVVVCGVVCPWVCDVGVEVGVVRGKAADPRSGGAGPGEVLCTSLNNRGEHCGSS